MMFDTKAEAIKGRRELQKTFQDGRKVHYAKLGDAGFYLWVDKPIIAKKETVVKEEIEEI